MVDSMRFLSSRNCFSAGTVALIVAAALMPFAGSTTSALTATETRNGGLAASVSGAYIHETDTYIAIGNNNLELGFDKQTGGGLDRILDKNTGIDLRSDKAAPSILFLIYFDNGTGIEGALQWNGVTVTYDADTGSNYAQITINYGSLKGYDMHATVLVTVQNDASVAEMRLSVTNNEQFTLTTIYFPYIWGLGTIGSDSDDDTLLYPAGDGILFHNPAGHMGSPFPTDGIYPGSLSMQMMCYYDRDEAGLYMATYDTEGNPKRMNFASGEWGGTPHLMASYTLLFPQYPGNDFSMEYDVVVGTFNGDWYEAASMYRAWAETAPFTSAGKVYEGKDIPEWYASTSIIQLLNRDGPTIEIMPLADIVDVTREYSDYTGLDTTALIIGWEQNGAWVSPYYYPPIEGEDAFRDAMAALSHDGNHGFIYISGSAWRITRDDIGYEGYELFNSTGLPWVALDENGQPTYDLFYETLGWHTARMDPMTDFWHTTVVENALEGVRLGVDVVQVDEFPIGAIYPCYNASHGHPVGYSRNISHAYRAILADIRSQGRGINPDFIMSIEEPCEFYIPYIDTYVSRDNAPEALLYGSIVDAYGESVEFIPLFSHVYHEYVTAFAEGTTMDNYHAALYYNQMARSFARACTSGEIVKAGGATSDMRNEDLFELFKHTAGATATYANEYLIRGEPLVPPEITVPMKRIDWFNWYTNQSGTPIYEPAVTHSAWRADDGSLGLVFVNWATENVSFDVEFPSYGSTGESYSIILTRNGESVVVDYNTTLPQVFNLSLAQNDVVLLEATGVIENLPPNKPLIAGPSSGKVNTNYIYTAHATEPDGDTISYMFDWGDGTMSDWMGPYGPSDSCVANHSWSESGTYGIRVRAKDEHGAESEWSDPLPVTMPRIFPFNLFILERIYGLLQCLIGSYVMSPYGMGPDAGTS